ncbi:hypothetical protein LCGC14_0343270 [marine sediment metagenome]|uniref:Uncharacterized protein n=1 Tax=marine sediment metagenome TaxID=412755 RepID=A0A0F9TIP8_9ZZZZ
MSQVTYNSEKHDLKKVKLQNDSGSTITVRGGHLVVYNANFGTAADSDEKRSVRVEVNASGNSEHFAGVIDTRYDGKLIEDGRFLQMEVAVPVARGQLVEIWTDQNCTLGATVLTLRPTSFVAGGIEDGVPIAVAQQTVDRSSTAGTVLARLQWPLQPLTTSGFVSTRSRAVTALPTAAIWDNIPVTAMLTNPFLGSALVTDFTHGSSFPDNRFVDATYAATALGKTILEGIYGGVTAIGELKLFTSEDNGAAEAQWTCPIDIDTAGTKWAFEARFKVSNITTAKMSAFVGLALAQNLGGDFIADAGAVPTTGTSYVGYFTDDAATAALDLDYLLSGQTHVEHNAAIKTMVADTYFTVGMYYDGTDIQTYTDGVTDADPILGTGDMDDGNFPTGTFLVPTIALKGGHGDDAILTLDWFQVGQLA